MNWYEILSLIISILSLIATVAVSFVIYFLENRREKVAQEREKNYKQKQKNLFKQITMKRSSCH